MNSVFESNMRLVPYVYEMCFTNYKELKEDLMQEGYIGLLRAIDKYKPELDTSFSTFAFFCIRNAMGMYMRKELKHIENTITDVVDCGNEEVSLFDCLIDEESEKNAEDKILCDLILEKMPNKDIVKRWLYGETQASIGKSKGRPRGWVNKTIKRDIGNIKQEFEYNK